MTAADLSRQTRDARIEVREVDAVTFDVEYDGKRLLRYGDAGAASIAGYALELIGYPALAARVDALQEALRDAEWQQGEPSSYGYYLAAYELRRKIVVSELWFNPDAIRRWWFTRAYTGEPKRGGGLADAVTSEVVAWMPLPEPPAALAAVVPAAEEDGQ